MKRGVMLLVAALMLCAYAAPVAVAGAKGKATQASVTKKKEKGGKKNGQTKGKNASAAKRGSAAGKKSTGNRKKESSADLKRQQEATQKEIRRTREEIARNEAEVKKNLNALGLLQNDIDAGQKKVADASAKVAALQTQISTLQTQIAADEQTLAKLRKEYLAAVKKMRTKRKEQSKLAFIFSAGSFNEALRRMRYLRQFSEWRGKRTDEIGGRIETLKAKTRTLSQAKQMHDKALAADIKARDELKEQYVKQDAIVVELKKNGNALRSHLAKKQAEVNQLKGRVSALIAEEQRKAEADRRARERAEAERAEQARIDQAREEQRRREREERELAEANREREAAKERETAKAQEQEKNKHIAKADKPEPKKKAAKPVEKNHVSPAETGKKTAGKVDYAEARKRKPRAKNPQPETSAPKPAPRQQEQNAGKVTSSGSFAQMKGSLPRPVSGSFRVTSRFGRHSLPDMPDVMFDNPGIDAEVSPGAHAKAVYAGKVSGVYMIPGYSTVVILNHDGYYTVYGNLASAAVSVGDKVKQGDTLGSVVSSEDDPSHGLFHFEVWKNRDKLDPSAWIR